MSSRHLAPSEGGERRQALQRLQTAIAERGRALETRESASDTHRDLEASASLRTADDQVLARERWLKAVDDQDY
jgi:hypothetical protein